MELLHYRAAGVGAGTGARASTPRGTLKSTPDGASTGDLATATTATSTPGMTLAGIVAAKLRTTRIVPTTQSPTRVCSSDTTVE
jgi:hypothetical protein